MPSSPAKVSQSRTTRILPAADPPQRATMLHPIRDNLHPQPSPHTLRPELLCQEPSYLVPALLCPTLHCRAGAGTLYHCAVMLGFAREATFMVAQGV